MALSPDLLEILRCPEDRSTLEVADADLLAKLNAAIEAGSVKNREGQAVTDKVDALLVRADKTVGYAVRDDIPVMLVDEQIKLDQLG